ncbi:MAG: hypothetical protein WC637_10505 [Victivallales bacterium]
MKTCSNCKTGFRRPESKNMAFCPICGCSFGANGNTNASSQRQGYAYKSAYNRQPHSDMLNTDNIISKDPAHAKLLIFNNTAECGLNCGNIEFAFDKGKIMEFGPRVASWVKQNPGKSILGGTALAAAGLCVAKAGAITIAAGTVLMTTGGAIVTVGAFIIGGGLIIGIISKNPEIVKSTLITGLGTIAVGGLIIGAGFILSGIGYVTIAAGSIICAAGAAVALGGVYYVSKKLRETPKINSLPSGNEAVVQSVQHTVTELKNETERRGHEFTKSEPVIADLSMLGTRNKYDFKYQPN